MFVLDSVSQLSPGCHAAHSGDQADLELIVADGVSVFEVLGIKVCSNF